MVYTCMYVCREDHFPTNGSPVRNLLLNISCAVKELTRDSLRHDVLHLAAGRHDPRAQVVQNQYLKMTMTNTIQYIHIYIYTSSVFSC